MRIGIDASNLRAGGGLTYISKLLGAINPTEIGIKSIYVWAGKSTIERLPPPNGWLNIVHLDELDKSIAIRLYWQRYTLPKIAKKSCDVLFLPGASGYVGFHPSVAMPQNMLPFESFESRRFKWSLPRIRYAIIKKGLSKALCHSAGNIFLTNYAFENIKNQIDGMQTNHAIIPHGIDNRFLKAPRKQNPINEFSDSIPFRLLYVSIVNFYKHQWNVVKAIKILREKGMPVTIDLVGPAYPAALSVLEETISEIDPHHEFVNYHGSISYERLPEIYHNSDGFIFASSCENLPIILLEAMAAGLPIASSKKGPMPEVLKNFGGYFDPENVQEIADTIELLLKDANLRQNYAEQAYREALTYSWEKCAHETFSFLKGVAE